MVKFYLINNIIRHASHVIKITEYLHHQGRDVDHNKFNVHFLSYNQLGKSRLKTFGEYYMGSEPNIDNGNGKEILNSAIKVLQGGAQWGFIIGETAFFDRWLNEIGMHVKWEVTCLRIWGVRNKL